MSWQIKLLNAPGDGWWAGGDVLSGELVTTLEQTKVLKKGSLDIQFEGTLVQDKTVYTTITEGKSGNPMTSAITVRDATTLIDVRKILLGPVVQLNKGTHVFPFQFQLPLQLLPTSSAVEGNVRVAYRLAVISESQVVKRMDLSIAGWSNGLDEARALSETPFRFAFNHKFQKGPGFLIELESDHSVAVKGMPVTLNMVVSNDSDSPPIDSIELRFPGALSSVSCNIVCAPGDTNRVSISVPVPITAAVDLTFKKVRIDGRLELSVCVQESILRCACPMVVWSAWPRSPVAMGSDAATPEIFDIERNGGCPPEAIVSLLLWQPDKSSKLCFCCEKPWTPVRRRHHCRWCGSLVCKDCAPKLKKPPTIFVGDDDTRLCMKCMDAAFGERSSPGITPGASNPFGGTVEKKSSNPFGSTDTTNNPFG